MTPKSSAPQVFILQPPGANRMIALIGGSAPEGSDLGLDPDERWSTPRPPPLKVMQIFEDYVMATEIESSVTADPDGPFL